MPSTISSTSSRSSSRRRQVLTILNPHQAGENLLALQDYLKSAASAWERPEAVRDSFYLAKSSPSSTGDSSPIKAVVHSAYQKSFIKNCEDCTALISKFYTSLGTLATPHGLTQEAQRRYADFSAIKKTLLKHTAYRSLHYKLIAEMKEDESTVMVNMFANLYPNGHLQDNAQTRDLSKTLFEGCKSYSDPTIGPTAKSAKIMRCENTERERTKAIMEDAYAMMKAIGVESLRKGDLMGIRVCNLKGSDFVRKGREVMIVLCTVCSNICSDL